MIGPKRNTLHAADAFPIDVVLTWVDGDDPRHKAKMSRFVTSDMQQEDDIAGTTRFKSVGEIFFCVASINKFAPWVRKIFVVTDEQNPHLEEFLSYNFPDGSIPVEIVDHRVIFRGYEQYLPTFNSISIETMTWRIPGLSEHYIEFNDDFILAAPVLPRDFFPRKGRVICYGKRYFMPVVRLTRLLKRHNDGTRKVTFKETMINGAKLLGHSLSFIKIYHTPRPLLRSVYEEFFSKYPEVMMRNISHRFRSPSQFNSQEIMYLLLMESNRCEKLKAYTRLLYIKPRSLEHIKEKLQKFDKRPDYIFACFNSVDQTSLEGQRMIKDWLYKRIGIKPLP